MAYPYPPFPTRHSTFFKRGTASERIKPIDLIRTVFFARLRAAIRPLIGRQTTVPKDLRQRRRYPTRGQRELDAYRTVIASPISRIISQAIRGGACARPCQETDVLRQSRLRNVKEEIDGEKRRRATKKRRKRSGFIRFYSRQQDSALSH